MPARGRAEIVEVVSHRSTDRGTLWALLAAHLGPVLTLDDAYRRAIERSPELRLLEQRIADAEVNVGRAWALLKPQLDATYTFTHSEPEPPEISFPNLTSDDVVDNCKQGGDPVACITALQASLEDPLVLDLAQGDTHIAGSRITWSPLNGRAIPLIANAYDSVDAERDRSRAQRQQLLMSVARAYYSSAATRHVIDAARRAVERAQGQLGLVEARASVGDSASLAMRAAEGAAREAALDLLRAENAHRQSLLALWQLTASSDAPDVVDPPVPEVPNGDRAALIALARAHRRDLSAADRAVAIAERAKDDVLWRLAPVVGAFGAYRYSNVRGLGGQNSQWTLGVTATLQIYDGGLRYQDLRAADARIATAALTKQSLEARLEADVDRSLLALEGAELGIRRAEEGLALAESALLAAKAQFEVGAIRSVDLEEANDRVLDADVALIRARMERATAVLDLRFAVGLFDPT